MLPTDSFSGSIAYLWSALAKAASNMEEGGVRDEDGIDLLQRLFEQAVTSRFSSELSVDDANGSASCLISSLPWFTHCSTLLRSLLDRLVSVSKTKEATGH